MIAALVAGLAMLLVAMPATAQGISFPGAVPRLTVNSATAGSQPNSATASSTYNLTTSNSNNGRVTVRLAQPLPSGWTLRVNLAAPAGGSSSGWVTLTQTEQNALTSLNANKTYNNLTMQYELSGVLVSHGVVAATNYGVVFTVY